MPKYKIALLLTLAVTGAAAITGCGGDDSSDSSSDSDAAAPTKAEFITQADQICQDSIDTIQEESADLNAESSEDDVLAFAEDVYIPELNSEVEALQALTPPEGDEETVEEMFASLEDGVSEISDDPNVVINGDASPLADATEKAKAYGLKVCGSA